MSMGILGTALSGLSAYQKALDTTSNNISNVNTPGYSVQHVKLESQSEQYTGAGFVGSGVSVTNIVRSYDQFLNAQVLAGTSAYNSSNTYYTMASQVDNMIADQSTGLSSSMNTFFNAVNSVVNDPTSIPSRQVLISNAGNLASQFNSISSNFGSLRNQVNGNLTNSVTQLNTYAQTIAQLNTQIVTASNNGTGLTPNGLLDQRDATLSQLAQLTNVSVVNQANGSISLFIGQGQPLVLGSNASTLVAQSSATDNSHMQIMLNGQDISSQITGGQIAGNLQFRDQVLDPAQQQLGVLATGLATTVNGVQTSGYDLTGTQGTPIFDLGAPSVQVNGNYSDPNLVVSAAFFQPTATQVPGLAAAYQLKVTSTPPNAYSLTNLSNNSTVSGLDDTTLPTTANADGFSISFPSGTLTTGDTFQISPSFSTASTITVNPSLTPTQIAAAGSATAGPGDNSNAVALANLQTQSLMNGTSALPTTGTNTFSQVYSQLVTGVGANTNTAKLNSTAQNTALQNATAAQQSTSGVNLNEEAAKLIQFQNAYQAAAKTVTVAQTLFTAMLNAIG